MISWAIRYRSLEDYEADKRELSTRRAILPDDPEYDKAPFGVGVMTLSDTFRNAVPGDTDDQTR